MKLPTKCCKNEKGAVILASLMVMMLLTLIGISATTTTSLDLQIAAHDRWYKEAFHNADSGVYAAPKLISRTISAGHLLDGAEAGGFDYLPRDAGETPESSFYRQVMGFDAYDGGAPDIRFTLGAHRVDIDVNRIGEEAIAGSGVEFASGAEGIGTGAAGGVALLYDMTSQGSGPANASSAIGAIYRKVAGVPGGL